MKKTMLSMICAMAAFTGVASAQVSLGAQASGAAHVDTKPVVQGVQHTSDEVTNTSRRTVDRSTRAVDRGTRSASRHADNASQEHVDASVQTSAGVNDRGARHDGRVSAGTNADLDARNASGSAAANVKADDRGH